MHFFLVQTKPHITYAVIVGVVHALQGSVTMALMEDIGLKLDFFYLLKLARIVKQWKRK